MENNNKLTALFEFLKKENQEIKISDIKLCDYKHYWLNIYEYWNKEYSVGVELENDDAFSLIMDNYINEYILTQIPKVYHDYFDYDLYKKDRYDERGQAMASYSLNENKIKINNEYYYI